MLRFGESDLYKLCDTVAAGDEDMAMILRKYGYPPFWNRPNTFASLVHIILEQQVSLASALAALNQLKKRLPQFTADHLVQLTDKELRDCYVSRQKSAYLRDLAESVLSGRLSLSQLPELDEHTIRARLTAVKGIGNWTVDVYLLFVLHHTDIFPLGDLAAVNALRQLKGLPVSATKEMVEGVVEQWKPYRSIAAMMLWHYYLESRKEKGGNVFKKKSAAYVDLR